MYEKVFIPEEKYKIFSCEKSNHSTVHKAV